MILAIQVKNVLGFNYSLSFRSGRRIDKSFTIKGCNLFTTYHITNGKGDASYKRIIAPFQILRVLGTDGFRIYCESIETTSAINLEFLIIDPIDHRFRKAQYSIVMSKEGILEECVDGTLVIPKVRSNPFKSFAPAIFLDYFELLITCDLEDRVNMLDMEKVFDNVVHIPSFVKFLIQFVKLGGFRITNIYKDNKGVIQVKQDQKITAYENDKKLFTWFHKSPKSVERFKIMCTISWAVWTVFIRTGIIVLHNIDKVLDYESLYNLVEMFNTADELDMNTAQLIFSAKDQDFNLYPEQVMEVSKQNEITYCTWQNF